MYGVKNKIMTKTITQNKVYLMDCLEGMRNTPNKWYDLAVVDPPYGLNIAASTNYGESGGSDGRWKTNKKDFHTARDWDKNIPTSEYFTELKRVSKNQIVWGWNYFAMHFDNCPSYIVWNKEASGNYSDCELAWCSIKGTNSIFKWLWNGFRKQQPEDRTHPTQKPIALYDWIFQKYATKGMKILDTHAGSMSSVISALKNDMQITAYEIDSDYFNAGKQRIEAYLQQGNMFQQPTIEFINH